MKTILWFLITSIIALTAIYLMGCFIAWDYNIMHWWLVKTILGRILFIIMLIYILPSCFALSMEMKDNYL